MEIAVVPEALSSAGSGLSATGAEVDSANATMSAAASGVPGACGFPEPAGAFEDLASSWRGAIARSADGVSALGATMDAAAALYVFTDLTAIP
jgi:Excreted virulence factor EspC, type VII ESX diderm